MMIHFGAALGADRADLARGQVVEALHLAERAAVGRVPLLLLGGPGRTTIEVMKSRPPAYPAE